ncbi:MAG TPA: FHA domain-containing protein [Solirubrobacterales bacterium]|nr:FHA domain-containing protein [Solirubrobacterales bacterium]
MEVRVVMCEATFQLGDWHPSVSGSGPRPTRVEVTAPGCTIGRGGEADLQVVGPDSRGASRRHLLLQPSGRQWTVTDVGSRNHTLEVDPSNGDWKRVGPNRPLPVESEMLLNLGGRLILRFDQIVSVSADGTTTGSARGGPIGAARVRPVQLEEVAAALLARRRADRADRQAPSTAELLALVDCERATLFRRLSELKQLPEVAAVGASGRGDLCDALERAFPYLLASRSGGP